MSTASSHPSPALTATPSPANTTPTTVSRRTSDNSDEPKEFSLDGIPRSASYTQFPATTAPDASCERNGIKRTFSENIIANPKANNFRHASIKRASQRGAGSKESDAHTDLARGLSTKSKTEPKITISKFTLATEEDETDLSYEPKNQKKALDGDQGNKKKSVTRSLSRFARRSWMAPSRSPSPSKRRALERETNPNAHDAALKHPEPDTLLAAEGVNGSAVMNGHDKGQPENGIVRRTKPRRPLSSLITLTSPENSVPSVPPLPKSFSTDRLPQIHAHTSADVPPGLPKSISFERLQMKGTESTRRKDDLWSAFRALDGDFQKYVV